MDHYDGRKPSRKTSLRLYFAALLLNPSSSFVSRPPPFISHLRAATAAAAFCQDGGRRRRIGVRPHHTALWVKNITTSAAFYSLFGFEEERRFKAGPARAVWLQWQPSPSLESAEESSAVHLANDYHLELIEVPPYVASNSAPPAAVASAVDAECGSETRLAHTGMNHFALDVSEECRLQGGGLPAFLRNLNERSEVVYDRSIRLIVAPHERIIGQDVFEVGYIADPDGVLLELLSCAADPILHALEPSW